MPMSVEYTPGYTPNASDFMARRTVDTHGAFAIPLFSPGVDVVDLGCGPGSITNGIAAMVHPGTVIGVDRESSQIHLARAAARALDRSNCTFVVGSVTSITLDAHSADVVFAHALFEHLQDPPSVLTQVKRVLRDGGHIALRSPDWGGFIVHPDVDGLGAAIAAYEELQTRNGGDVHAGRKLASWIRQAGFDDIRTTASYEIYQDPSVIGDYLARRLDAEPGAGQHARAIRQWSHARDNVFMQAWVEVVGRKPPLT
jgi:ubiquinone/menaquinone biosynthesis C-methylase UbiE